MEKQKKKIVILGGGFGGLYTYKGLYKHFSKDDIEVTIVNRNNYFIFTPLLHEVATGGVEHHQVVESIRQIIYKNNDNLHIADVESIDCTKQIVKTSLSELSYDILVVALGATTNFFGTPGAEENSLILKDLRDAIILRNALVGSFENASEIKDRKKREHALSFAVIGGGPTGVEIVSEIAELFNDTLLRYYKDTIKREDVSLYLVNRSSEILTPFPPSLRKSALKMLEKKGIKVILNSAVKEVSPDSIILDDGRVLEVSHTIWAAGVKPNNPKFIKDFPVDSSGRVIVNEFLQVGQSSNVFVLGDSASVMSDNGKPLPMLAQVAVKQGLLTGENIWRMINHNNLKKFIFKSNGMLASLWLWHAVADLKGIHLSGPLAWFIWRTVYLFKFLSGSKKIKIVVDWTLNIFYPRDITKA